MKSENQLTFVSSRGILKSCNVCDIKPVSSSKNLSYDYRDIKQGDVVYGCSSAILEIKKLVKNLTCSIVLVTGDSDNDILGDSFLDKKEFIEFIENDSIIHWYSQNCTFRHPKLSPIPIGLDYHTLTRGPHSWGPRMTPEQQEVELMQIRDKAKPFWEREPAYCYANFHFLMTTRYGIDRREAVRLIPNHLVYYEVGKITRKRTWEKQAQFAFVISPHGNGYDCHRTWEALCLGCIPIVKSSPIDALFEDLPVMIVENWNEVTAEKLKSVLSDFKNRKFNFNKLYMKYWVDKIHSLVVS